MFASFGPGHIGINVSLEEGAALAARHGFQGLDFNIKAAQEYAREHGVAALKGVFESNGLRLGAWGLPFVPYRIDEEEWTTRLEELAPQAEFAASIGATRTAMWILPGSNERPLRENFDFHLERFAPIIDLLAEHGIRIGLEFVGPKTSRDRFKHEFLWNQTQMLEFCRTLGSNVGLLLDSWHWHTSGGTARDLAELTNDSLVHVHLNDAPAGIPLDEQLDHQRKLPGATGVIDIQAFLTGLRNAGYDGPITAEPFDQELNALPPEEATAATSRALLSVLNHA